LKKIAERLTWCTALKDQAGIIKDLADGKDVEEVYGLVGRSPSPKSDIIRIKKDKIMSDFGVFIFDDK